MRRGTLRALGGALLCLGILSCKKTTQSVAAAQTQVPPVSSSASPPSPTPVPSTPLTESLVAVAAGGDVVPGLAVDQKSVPDFSFDAETLIVAPLADARIGQGVYLYRLSDGKSASRREEGEVIGVDPAKGVAFIDSRLSVPAVPFPSRSDAGKEPLAEFKLSVAWEAAPEMEPAAKTPGRDSRIPLIDFQTVFEARQNLREILSKARRRSGGSASSGEKILDSLGEFDRGRYEESLRTINAAKRSRRMEPPPALARCTIDRIAPPSDEPAGLLATSDSAFVAFTSEDEDGRLHRAPLAEARSSSAGLKEVDLHWRFSEGDQTKTYVSVSAGGEFVPEYDWEDVELTVIEAEHYTKSTDEGAIVDNPQSALASNRVHVFGSFADRRKTSFLSSTPSSFDESEGANAFAISTTFTLPRGSGSKKFVGQLSITRTHRSTLYTEPFVFTLIPGSRPRAALESHPFARLATPRALGNQPGNFVSSITSLKTNGRVRDAIPAESGGLLAIKQDAAPFIRFADLKKKQWSEPLPLTSEADNLIAASGDLFYILRNNRILEKWNLRTGKKEKAGLLDIEDPVLAMAAAPATETAPLLLATRKSVFFVDAETLKVQKTNIRTDPNPDLEQTDFLFEFESEPHAFRASASGDGSVYAVSCDFDSEASSKQMSAAYVFAPDSDLRNARVRQIENAELGYRGRYGFSRFSRTDIRHFLFPERFYESKQPYFLEMEGPRSDWNNRTPTLGDEFSNAWLTAEYGAEGVTVPGDFPILKFCLGDFENSPKAISPSAVIRDAEELREVSLRNVDNPDGTLPIERRIHLLASQRQLVTIGRSDREIVIRDLNFDGLVSGARTLVVSAPPNAVKRSETMEYPIAVATRSTASFALESGPAGATVSADGVVRWDVPSDFEADTAEFEIAVATDGQSQDYKFDVDLTGDKPVTIYLARPLETKDGDVEQGLPPNSTGKTVAVPSSAVHLPGPVIAAAPAEGGRLLVCAIKDQPQIVVVDLVEKKIAQSLTIREPTPRIAASKDAFFVYYRSSRILEKRSLDDFSLVKSVTARAPLLLLCTDADSVNAPILIAQPSLMGLPHFALLNPVTLDYLPVPVSDELANQLPTSGSFRALPGNRFLPNDSDCLLRLTPESATVEKTDLNETRTSVEKQTRNHVYDSSSGFAFSSSLRFVIRSHRSTGRSDGIFTISDTKDLRNFLLLKPVFDISEIPYSNPIEAPFDNFPRLYLNEELRLIAAFCDDDRSVLILPWKPEEWIGQLTAP